MTCSRADTMSTGTWIEPPRCLTGSPSSSMGIDLVGPHTAGQQLQPPRPISASARRARPDCRPPPVSRTGMMRIPWPVRGGCMSPSQYPCSDPSSDNGFRCKWLCCRRVQVAIDEQTCAYAISWTGPMIPRSFNGDIRGWLHGFPDVSTVVPTNSLPRSVKV